MGSREDAATAAAAIGADACAASTGGECPAVSAAPVPYSGSTRANGTAILGKWSCRWFSVATGLHGRRYGPTVDPFTSGS